MSSVYDSERSFSYLGQRVVVPIVLSENDDARLACLAAAMPSAVFMLGYHFILKPRRRKERAE